ncbi:YbfB/YjiJ family MFS transporter [Variovorax sp. NFACC27]|uniref:YbfB/YjiJ family MFS transporter n=1 Tax=unclassified Variovorax TaxID=663243 RepID=UPI0008957521|nr:Predicted arabinose efflux permease, MFS family [Variovorax sp. NFACC28]SEG70845.1 Predicted arabinose efflux permease, MFS family [Variovorax sp. NFACC29]SFC81620.1 Predicted arabinose efflux permease, MFS family [Variovorax sp. NFACC26]SFF98699.1 Predicted arabinose efflux permease, MFS family [Variovorax sp. NFACC27]
MSEIGRDRRGAWRAALACMVTLSVAMGLGRFAFTPMLPIMLHEGKLELAAGGVLASLNYLGYFLGAVSCAAIGIKASSMVRGGLVATAALLVGMGLLHSFTSWGVLRTAAGVMSAWVFVFASGWGLRRLAETNAPTLAGVIYTGPGIGIAMTGLLGGALGRWGSEAGWIGLGVLAVVLIAVIWRVFDDGEHVHAAGGAAPAPAAAARVAGPADRSDAIWLVALYGLAGFGYIITATFLPVIARQALPGSPWPDFFWPLFGLAIIPGALIGARAPTHWDNRLLLAVAYALQALGVVLSVAWPSIAGFALGSLLLGMPFTAITLFAMRDARRLRGNAAAGLIGYATASYGVGQIVGPLFAAPLAQRTGSFQLPLLVAAAALALGAVLFALVWFKSRGNAGQ